MSTPPNELREGSKPQEPQPEELEASSSDRAHRILAAAALIFLGVTVVGFLATPLENPHPWLLVPAGCTIALAVAWLSWPRCAPQSALPDERAPSEMDDFAAALAASAGAGAIAIVARAVDEGALVGTPLMICLVVSVTGVSAYLVSVLIRRRRRRLWLTALVGGEIVAYVEWPFRRLRPHVAAVGAVVVTAGSAGLLQVAPRHRALTGLTGHWRIVTYSILESTGWTRTQRWGGETWRISVAHGCRHCGYVVTSSYESSFRLHPHGKLLTGSRYTKATCASLQSNGTYRVTTPALARNHEDITVIPNGPEASTSLTIVRTVQGETTPESERQGCRLYGRAQLMSLATRS